MASNSRNQKLFLKKYYSSKIYLWEWLAVAAVVLLTMLSFSHIDIKTVTIWSTNLWDVIAEGKPFSFYEYTAKNEHLVAPQYMGLDIFAILPLWLWNLPIWIIQHTTGKDIAYSAGLLAWSKLGLELCNLVLAFLAYKMSFLITKDKERSAWASIMTVGSSACLICVGVVGQIDVFAAVYAALCVYFMMKGKRKLSILFAALSIAVKPLFAFAFLPILLLVEKNLLIALLQYIISFSLLGLDHLIGRFLPLYKESVAANPPFKLFYDLFNVGIEAPYGKSSLFVFGVLAFCFIFCFTKPESDDERNKFLIYIPAGVFMMMCSLGKADYYSGIMIMPYLPVLIVINTHLFRLDLVLMFCYQFFHSMEIFAGVKESLSGRYTVDSFLEKFIKPREFSQHKDNTFRDFVLGMDPNGYISKFLINACSGAVIVAIVLILVLNYPRFKHKFDMGEKAEFEKYDHGLLMINSLVFLPFLLVLFDGAEIFFNREDVLQL